MNGNKIKNPVFTTEAIQTEIDTLPETHPASKHYLNRELDRREASKRNKGRPIKHKDEKHKKWREASAKYRKNQPRKEKTK